MSCAPQPNTKQFVVDKFKQLNLNETLSHDEKYDSGRVTNILMSGKKRGPYKCKEVSIELTRTNASCGTGKRALVADTTSDSFVSDCCF